MNLDGKVLIGRKRPSALGQIPTGEALKIELLPSFKPEDVAQLQGVDLQQCSIEFSLEKPWKALLVNDIMARLKDVSFTNVAFPSLVDFNEGAFRLLLDALNGLKSRGFEFVDMKLTPEQQTQFLSNLQCENLHLDNVPVSASSLQLLTKLHRLTLTKALPGDAPGPQLLQVKQLVLIQQKLDSKTIQALPLLFDFTKIQYLAVDDCKLCDELFGQLSGFFGPALNRLSLKNNYLTDGAVEIIVNNCQLKHSIQSLNLQGNKMSIEALKMIRAEIIDKTNKLKELNLSENLLWTDSEIDLMTLAHMKLNLDQNFIKGLENQAKKLKNTASIMAEMVVAKRDSCADFKLQAQALTLQFLSAFYGHFQRFHKYLSTTKEVNADETTIQLTKSKQFMALTEKMVETDIQLQSRLGSFFDFTQCVECSLTRPVDTRAKPDAKLRNIRCLSLPEAAIESLHLFPHLFSLSISGTPSLDDLKTYAPKTLQVLNLPDAGLAAEDIFSALPHISLIQIKSELHARPDQGAFAAYSQLQEIPAQTLYRALYIEPFSLPTLDVPKRLCQYCNPAKPKTPFDFELNQQLEVSEIINEGVAEINQQMEANMKAVEELQALVNQKLAQKPGSVPLEQPQATKQQYQGNSPQLILPTSPDKKTGSIVQTTQEPVLQEIEQERERQSKVEQERLQEELNADVKPLAPVEQDASKPAEAPIPQAQTDEPIVVNESAPAKETGVKSEPIVLPNTQAEKVVEELSQDGAPVPAEQNVVQLSTANESDAIQQPLQPLQEEVSKQQVAIGESSPRKKEFNPLTRIAQKTTPTLIPTRPLEEPKMEVDENLLNLPDLQQSSQYVFQPVDAADRDELLKTIDEQRAEIERQKRIIDQLTKQRSVQTNQQPDVSLRLSEQEALRPRQTYGQVAILGKGTWNYQIQRAGSPPEPLINSLLSTSPMCDQAESHSGYIARSNYVVRDDEPMRFSFKHKSPQIQYATVSPGTYNESERKPVYIDVKGIANQSGVRIKKTNYQTQGRQTLVARPHSRMRIQQEVSTPNKLRLNKSAYCPKTNIGRLTFNFDEK